MRFFCLLTLLSFGCNGGGNEPGSLDKDGDGYAASIDCDDANILVYPGAEERCDGLDNNCDGEVDVGDIVDGLVFYADLDGDGFGDLDSELMGCSEGPGMVADATDCNDQDAAFHPGAEELNCADPADYNCDGSVGYVDADGDGAAACEDCDDSNPDAYPDARWYLDKDGDGYGVPVMAQQCLPPEGFVNNVDDCDDRDAEIHPETHWYLDSDGDGYGTWNEVIQQCEPMPGYVFYAGDCNDADPMISPETVWFRDADMDGYGTDTDTLVGCAPASGFVLHGGDCDDANSALSPLTVWLEDSDGDGFGDPDKATQSCEQPAGMSPDWVWDCDDSDPVINPNTKWYADVDGDGFGNSAIRVTRCEQPSHFVLDATDCDDTNSTVFPAAEEQCDGLDHDCDGSDGLAECIDCQAILDEASATSDGLYDVDVDGVGGGSTFEVYCDMTTDGGGWTQFWWFDAGASMTSAKDVLGEDLEDCDPAVDSTCMSLLPVSSPQELMVMDERGNWATWSFSNTNSTSALVLDALTTGTPIPLECGDVWNPSRQGGPDMTEAFRCGDGSSSDEGCACFEYDSISTIWSFALDNDGDAADTAFAAGYDADSALGVDALDVSDASNSQSKGMQIFWR